MCFVHGAKTQWLSTMAPQPILTSGPMRIIGNTGPFFEDGAILDYMAPKLIFYHVVINILWVSWNVSRARRENAGAKYHGTRVVPNKWGKEMY